MNVLTAALLSVVFVIAFTAGGNGRGSVTAFGDVTCVQWCGDTYWASAKKEDRYACWNGCGDSGQDSTDVCVKYCRDEYWASTDDRHACWDGCGGGQGSNVCVKWCSDYYSPSTKKDDRHTCWNGCGGGALPK